MGGGHHLLTGVPHSRDGELAPNALKDARVELETQQRKF